jgi:hypothetical protein
MGMSNEKLFDFSIAWEGIDEVLNNLDNAVDEVIEAAEKGLTDDVLMLLGDAVRDAPIEVGDLRGSGHADMGGVTIAKGNKNGGIDVVSTETPHGLEAMVTFEEPYALTQHEHLEYQHPRGGKAKYLEDPLKQNATKYRDHIADKIKEALND